MNIDVVSLHTEEYKYISKYTSINHGNYCKINNYDYILFEGRLSNRRSMWDKILVVQKVLSKYDYVFWIDIDAIFVNFNIKIESFIVGDYNLYISNDPNKDVYVNSGVFIIKKSDWSFKSKDTFIIHYMGTNTSDSLTKENVVNDIINYNKLFNVELIEINIIHNEIIKGNKIKSGIVEVNKGDITGYFKYDIYDSNILCFEYYIPPDRELRHCLKINSDR